MSSQPSTRRTRASIAANPVLIGAVTVLVAAVGVFLSYNANKGLPFVPTYTVSVQLPDAAELVPGNDVREGGSRVGQISKIRAVRTAHAVHAVAELKLAKRAGPLPADSHVVVRQRSSLGLKYLEILPGRATRKIADGGMLANRGTPPAVDLDDLLDTFDAPTRTGIDRILTNLGAGTAGRGADLNVAVENLAPTLGSLARVSRNLAAPQTRLPAFLRAVSDTMTGLEPVAPRVGSFFAHAATTVAALDQRAALRSAIGIAGATAAADASDLAAARPHIDDAARLLRKLGPGARLLPGAATRLDAALAKVTAPLAGTRTTLADADPVLSTAKHLAQEPATSDALRQLSGLSEQIVPTLTYINPFQTQCNSLGLWTRNVPSFISEGDSLGTWFRALPVVQLDEMLARSSPAPQQHVDFYPDAGQNGTCEAGNTPYLPGQVIGPSGVKAPDHTEATSPPPGVPQP